jgi:acetolactate synthase-1/2/3 large subunit
MGQWTDSVPVLYISGQVKFETTIYSCPTVPLRQLGDQEVDIVSVVKPLTKFAEMIKNPLEVKYYLQKAIYLATHGRPGPVWIDVPLDVQGAMVEENLLKEFEPEQGASPSFEEEIDGKIEQVFLALENAKRPVFLAGNGIHFDDVRDLFIETIEQANIPVVTTFNGCDLIASDHPLFIGRMGTIGNRSGNFAVQNSDLLICVGTRNNIRQISYNYKSVARNAIKIIVDIDRNELLKPTIKPDIPICTSAKIFLQKFLGKYQKSRLSSHAEWIDWCIVRKEKYPVVLPEYRSHKGLVQPYNFIQVLTARLKESDVVVAGNGTASVTLFQAGIVKKSQRFIFNSGCAAMGYDLPAAIGACFANGRKDVVCLAGDGSIMMNLQELATVAYLNIPVKLFILNNDGYISIKQTQEAFFEKRYVACDKNTGVGFPSFENVVRGFNLPYHKINDNQNIGPSVDHILSSAGPQVCEVFLLPDYKFSPKLSSERLKDGTIVSKSLEDMFPFLDREEFRSNIVAG